MMKRNVLPNPARHFNAKVFSNQDLFGKEISHQFLDRSIVSILAIAPTQSGKTGSMLALIRYVLYYPSLSMPLDHVFIITGHSSTQWLEQTKQRFPASMHNRIYHRNNLDRFASDIFGIHSALVIIDENQIAFSEGQTIQKSFALADILTLDSLFSKDIKVVQFTATPLNVSDFDNNYSKIVCMTPSDDYVSIQSLLSQGRVKQYKDLCGKLPLKDYSKVAWNCPRTFIQPPSDIVDNISEILDVLPDDPRFHIIRTPPSYLHDVVISNFIQVFGNSFSYLSETLMDDFDSILLTCPVRHTFIFIKEKLRCAKTIPKLFLGVLYERTSNIVQDHVIVQGLAGRLTGYHANIDSVVFTNILSIRRYISLMDNQFAEGESKHNTFTFKPIKPITRPSVKPAVKPSLKPEARPAVKPAVRPAVRPSVRPAVRPSLRPVIVPEQ